LEEDETELRKLRKLMSIEQINRLKNLTSEHPKMEIGKRAAKFYKKKLDGKTGVIPKNGMS
jgi:hypothetical protein